MMFLEMDFRVHSVDEASENVHNKKEMDTRVRSSTVGNPSPVSEPPTYQAWLSMADRV